VAHLIVLPILNVYRKYYGLRMTGFLLGTSFVAIVGAALVIEVLFGAIGSIPETRTARVVEPEVTLNIHDGSERGLPGPVGPARVAVRAHRRCEDAPDDERTSEGGSAPLGPPAGWREHRGPRRSGDRVPVRGCRIYGPERPAEPSARISSIRWVR
jgi:hypothetical protein